MICHPKLFKHKLKANLNCLKQEMYGETRRIAVLEKLWLHRWVHFLTARKVSTSSDIELLPQNGHLGNNTVTVFPSECNLRRKIIISIQFTCSV